MTTEWYIGLWGAVAAFQLFMIHRHAGARRRKNPDSGFVESGFYLMCEDFDSQPILDGEHPTPIPGWQYRGEWK